MIIIPCETKKLVTLNGSGGSRANHGHSITMKERAIISFMDCVSVPSATLGLNTSVTRYLAVYSKVNFPNITEMYRRVDFKFCLKQNKLSKNG